MKKIMFNDQYGLTQSVLECKKTQTRRIINVPQHAEFIGWTTDNKKYGEYYDTAAFKIDGVDEFIRIKSRYKTGEVVAIAQSYASFYDEKSDDYIGYFTGVGFNNKMFVKADLMPNKIKITGIKAQRLQDISDEDCIKEGIKEGTEVRSDKVCFYYFDDEKKDERYCFKTGKEAYAFLINKICGKGTWERNPWVFAYEFELVKQ